MQSSCKSEICRYEADWWLPLYNPGIKLSIVCATLAGGWAGRRWHVGVKLATWLAFGWPDWFLLSTASCQMKFVILRKFGLSQLCVCVCACACFSFCTQASFRKAWALSQMPCRAPQIDPRFLPLARARVPFLCWEEGIPKEFKKPWRAETPPLSHSPSPILPAGAPLKFKSLAHHHRVGGCFLFPSFPGNIRIWDHFRESGVVVDSADSIPSISGILPGWQCLITPPPHADSLSQDELFAELKSTCLPLPCQTHSSLLVVVTSLTTVPPGPCWTPQQQLFVLKEPNPINV